MSSTNNTTDTTLLTSALPPCLLPSDLSRTNETSGDVLNSTDPQGCKQRSTNRGGRGGGLKTFYMHPKIEDKGLILSYDPTIGIQTAAILGSCLFLVMAYVMYKGRCGRERWTSSDRLFIENYKRKQLKRQWTVVQKNDVHEDTVKSESGSFEQTAKWIQSQPLDEVLQNRNFCKLNTCNICIESLKNPMCHLCNSNGHVPNANGMLSAPQISLISHSEVDITKYDNIIEMEMLQPPSFAKKYCIKSEEFEADQVRKLCERPSSLALRKDSVSSNGNNNIVCPGKEPPEEITLKTTAETVVPSFEKMNSKNLNPDAWPKTKVKKPNCDKVPLPKSRPRLTKQNRCLVESPPIELNIDHVSNRIPCTPIPLLTVPPLRSSGSNQQDLEPLPTVGALANQKTDTEATSSPLLLSVNQRDCDKLGAVTRALMIGGQNMETDNLLEGIPFMDEGSSCGSVPQSPRLSTQL